MSIDGATRRQVAELITLVHESDVTHLEIEHGDFALRVERDTLLMPLPIEASSATFEAGPDADEGPAFLRSPQVGTFYLSAEPGSEPFVNIGDVVEQGQVIGLIEAMKLISEVEAETGGTVQRILADDGQAVEYGQPLFELASNDDRFPAGA